MEQYRGRIVATLQFEQDFTVEAEGSHEALMEAAKEARSRLPKVPGLDWTLTDIEIRTMTGATAYQLRNDPRRLP